MALVAFELLFRFLWGGLVVLSFVSRVETSERFPRIASYIALGVAAFCAFLGGIGGLSSFTFYLCLILLVFGALMYAHTVGRWPRILGFLLYLLSPLLLWKHYDFASVYNFVSGALLLGSIYAAQYVGHWYLTVANLHIRELKRVVNVLFIALALKSAEVLYTLFEKHRLTQLHWSDIDVMGRPRVSMLLEDAESYRSMDAGTHLLGLQGESYFGLGLYGLIVLITRVLWGIVAPLIMAYMVKKTVDLRSTQSATGILYAMSVMSLVGEACAIYLLMNLGWNL